MDQKEKQNIEWKEIWKDEYLKWICGMTNSHGGKIYIGINDEGTIVGISDAKKLLEQDGCEDAAYLLADGRYMDRINAVYIYDGKTILKSKIS